MDNITFPLEPGMKGPEVANLQAVLQVLLDKKVILIPESINNRELLAGFKKECAVQMYGTNTSTLVGLLQQRLRLEANGKINEPIAVAINKFLQAGGYLEQPAPIDPPIDPPISVPISPPVTAPVNPPITIPAHIPVPVDKPVSSTVERRKSIIQRDTLSLSFITAN